MKQDERFGHAAGMLGERVRQVLERIPSGIGGTVSEIRLRVGQPLMAMYRPAAQANQAVLKILPAYSKAIRRRL